MVLGVTYGVAKSEIIERRTKKYAGFGVFAGFVDNKKQNK